MTGEEPTGGELEGAGAGSHLRVSHAERDQVVEVLREAAADGRLTADELDERVEAALSARTGRDLAVLTADLPATAAAVPAARDLVKINQRFGETERTGRWPVPRRMEIESTAGNVKLDFTEALISAPSLDIKLDLGMGSELILVIKPGIAVVTGDLTVRMGDVKVRQPKGGEDVPVVFTIELSGRVRGAEVTVRYPRRTPGQWIRRESAI
jgi:hypothetical protein